MVQSKDTTGIRATAMTHEWSSRHKPAEFHIADELDHVILPTAERNKRAKHPLRTALKAMIAEKKGESSHSLGSAGNKGVPLQTQVSESTDKLRRQKAITSRAKLKDNALVDHMRQTHASVLKKKELSSASELHQIKTFSGWRGK